MNADDTGTDPLAVLRARKAPYIAAIRAALAERGWSVRELSRQMNRTGSPDALARHLRNGTLSPCEFKAIARIFGDEWFISIINQGDSRK